MSATNKTTASYDFVVIGGGMVGASSALGLAKIGYKVLVVEQGQPNFSLDDQIDLRISAISQGSVNFLQQLNAWDLVKNNRCYAYNSLQTFQDPHKTLSFDADSIKQQNLGFMVENKLIQYSLFKQIEPIENITFLAQHTLLEAKFNKLDLKQQFTQDLNWSLTLQNINTEQTISVKTKLIIAADGANSKMRDIAGIGITGWEYNQHCMLILCENSQKSPAVTWQHMGKQELHAFLPLDNNYSCLVWYSNPNKIKQLAQLNPEQLEQQIYGHFPALLNQQIGKIKVLNYASFPLIRRHAQQYFKNNVILAGDSAHTINPLAGQGVNIGFKDVKELLKTAESMYNKPNIAIDNQFKWKKYELIRKSDNLIMQTGMDIFYKVAKSDQNILKNLRQIGLDLVDNSDLVKRKVLRYACGL